MKRIFQLICLLLAANCVAACSNTENDAPLGPIGETPAEEDPDAEHIYLWPEGNMPTETNYTVNSGNYQDDPDFRPNKVWYPAPDGWPHGFGVQGEWTTWFDSFLTQIMSH